MVKLKVINLKLNMQDPKGIMIPKGVKETLTVEIFDGSAVFSFKDVNTTRRFALFAIAHEAKRGVRETFFIKGLGKATTGYKGKTKEEIRDLLLDQFKKMGLNNKNE